MREVHLNDTCSSGVQVRLRCGALSSVCSLAQHLARQDNYTLADHDNNILYNQWLGLTLALLSAVLIGGSVILKKKALIRLADGGQTRAGEGGHGYLKDWLWWGGLLTMGAGEICNFVAYMFAPATLVTPLGALSVLFSAILSSCLLDEQLNVVGKLGCALCVLGSVLLVLHAPQEQEVTSLQHMTSMLLKPGFLVYMSIVSVLCVVLVILSPRLGRNNIFIYISICSLLGAFTVASVKGLAIAITTVYHDVTVLSSALTWILLFTLVVSVVTQVNYLNKSLDTYNTLLVYPIYYVLFTSVVLSTSIILFQEWTNMSAVDVVTTLGAFLVIVVGVAMLHLFKELQVSMEQVTNQLPRPGEQQEVSVVQKKEDKHRLMDHVVMESLPAMRDEGPRVFIIS